MSPDLNGSSTIGEPTVFGVQPAYAFLSAQRLGGVAGAL